MTVDRDDAACDQPTLEYLGAEAHGLQVAAGQMLVACREAAGLSQRDLGQRVGMARTRISKLEHGRPGGDGDDWGQMDEVCGAGGRLLAAYDEAQAAHERYRTRRRAAQLAARLQRGLDALQAARPPSGVVAMGPVRTGPTSDAAGPASADATMTDDLVQELHGVLKRLAKWVDRRTAIGIIGRTMAAVGLSGTLDLDALERVAGSVCAPRRVDARVIDHLATMLARAKRLEDGLGPAAVLPTVLAQYEIVRGLREHCPERLRPGLFALDSSLAASIGSYRLDLGDPEGATAYYRRARSAAHDAGSDTCACFALCGLSYVASLGGEVYTALDTSAAARNLAARGGDPLLRVLSEQIAAEAYALEGKDGACFGASDRAEDALSMADRSPHSLAYYVHPGQLASARLKCYLLLGRPADAVAAASLALERYDPQYVGRYARAQSRYAEALVALHEIDEAARVLADAATRAVTCPSARLTGELRNVRAKMQPWHGSQAVRTLDDRLLACGLGPGHETRV